MRFGGVLIYSFIRVTLSCHVCFAVLAMGTRKLPFLSQKNVILSGTKTTVTGNQANKLTLTTQVPYLRKDSNTATFSVKFNIKEKKTAIGFSVTQPPIDTYLIPDHYSERDYISMGGAGFLYPMRTSATRGYKEGDLVTVKLNFSNATISFFVNGDPVGSTPWPSSSSSVMIEEAYPFVSCEGGLLDMDIWSED